MAITLFFLAINREIVFFRIENRVISYYDKAWVNGLQIMPLLESNVKALENARSPNMRQYGKLIRNSNTGKDLEDYNACKTDEELAEMIRKDCISKGLTEVKEEDIKAKKEVNYIG